MNIRALVMAIPAILLSLSVHEFAHAWAATRLGDSTPVRQGRLTLSPLAHIDPIGTILFPAILALSGLPPFGWAKPVQFVPANFTRRVTMWQGTAIAAAAGPMSNIALAILSAIVLRVVIALDPTAVLILQMNAPQATATSMLLHFCLMMFEINIVLAVFNLFPLPPLDGSHFIPNSLASLKQFLLQYSFILFLLLFLIPIGGSTIGRRILTPVESGLKSLILGTVGL